MSVSLPSIKSWLAAEILKLPEANGAGWPSPAARLRKIIELAASKRETPVEARTFFRRFNTGCEPVLLYCSDENEYVTKSRIAGRKIITDHIVGHLGSALGAPVASVRLVNVSQDLIDAESQMRHLVAGVAHGGLWIPDCFDLLSQCAYPNKSNRPRYALLAYLFGWTLADDHQFICEKPKPHLVYSVDHCHFFAGGPNWTIQTLGEAEPAEVDRFIRESLQFRPGELADAFDALRQVDDFTIAVAVAAPPDEWGISLDERTALAQYFCTRRDQLIAAIQS